MDHAIKETDLRDHASSIIEDISTATQGIPENGINRCSLQDVEYANDN